MPKTQSKPVVVSAASSDDAPGHQSAEYTLRARFESVKQRVADAARRAGRRPDDVLIVAVTKFAAPEHIRELLLLGHADFAENRVQQMAQRAAMMNEFVERHRTVAASLGAAVPSRIRWHMVGHLQRNKVRQVLDLAALIHSVDSLRVAEEIQDHAARRESAVEVLLQVNASQEPQKFGVALPAAVHLAEQIDSMMNVRLRGLMAMAPLTGDAVQIKESFARARECFDDIRKAGMRKHFDILSLGMSNDFEMAIEAGANLVRIGSAIFGPPQPGEADEGDDQEAPEAHPNG